MVCKLLNTVQQQKDRLPGGQLPELSLQARKAAKAGGFSRKSRGGEQIEAVSGISSLQLSALKYRGDSDYSSYTLKTKGSE
jgi:hypothetical protein